MVFSVLRRKPCHHPYDNLSSFFIHRGFFYKKSWGGRLNSHNSNRIVTAVGAEVKRLKIGDRVFGFTWRSQKEKAHQEFVCAPENLVGVVPEGVSCKSIPS